VVVALRVTRARARVPLYLACVACAGKAVGGWSALARGCWWCSSSPRLMSMGHCSEQRTGFEVTKDWNGADQVAIRSPRGASVRVSCFCSAWDFFFFDYISDGRSVRHFWSRQKSFSWSHVRAFGCRRRSACTAGRSSRGGTTAARSSSSAAVR